MTHECIWVSKIFTTSVNNAGFMTDLLERDSEFAFAYNRKNELGESLEESCFPQKGWLLPEHAKRKSLAKFAAAGSFVYMSATCADVFRRFDLGKGALYPIELFEADGITPLADTWFTINFGNVKQCLLPEQSGELRPAPRGTYSTFATFDDWDLAFSASALDGPDVWIDPILNHSFCMSDRLAQALSEAGLLKYFDRVRRGKIVR